MNTDSSLSLEDHEGRLSLLRSVIDQGNYLVLPYNYTKNSLIPYPPTQLDLKLIIEKF